MHYRLGMSTTSLAEQVLSEKAPQKVADAAERIAGQAMEQIESSVPGALRGEHSQVRAYVAAYRQLGGKMLDVVGEARPDMVILDEAHNVVLTVEVKTHGGAQKSTSEEQSVLWLKAALEGEAMIAPFSDWVGTLGVGRGTAVVLVARLRSMFGDMEPVTLPRKRHLPAWPLSDEQVRRFYYAVGDELARAQTPLRRIASVLGLNRTKLARLFGVSRQAIEQWETRGVPAERQQNLATLDAIVDLLVEKLKRDRIAAMARRPADAYGGQSILDAIADGKELLVLDELREAFDWAAAA